ncbi:MAG: hypothetical protein IJS05_05720, partial [Paludibacteraceae bacterium]|nr:hypothetical protein [Paludibacteraceae bacterium]
DEVYWLFELMPVAPKNWTIGKPMRDGDLLHQTITVTNPGEASEMLFSSYLPGNLTFTFYENSDTPTRQENFYFYYSYENDKDSIK